MYAYPDFGTHTIAGETFDLMGGIIMMTISNNRQNLIFHNLASEVESSVPLRIINNSTIFANNANAVPREFVAIGRRGVQTAGEQNKEKVQ